MANDTAAQWRDEEYFTRMAAGYWLLSKLCAYLPDALSRPPTEKEVEKLGAAFLPFAPKEVKRG